MSESSPATVSSNPSTPTSSPSSPDNASEVAASDTPGPGEKPSSTERNGKLQPDGYRDILNVVDRLRQQGLNRYVDLPQIIVCGDQSSGKSSALEAISGMSFPSKDNLCTRFAIELILRRNPTSGIDVKIISGPNRSELEKTTLQTFGYSGALEELDLGKVVGGAKDAMGLNGASRVFSTDILRVEISGPDQPNLTIVDLPGLFVAGNKHQTEQDAIMVEQLVLSYMESPRTIILAVVSAKSDFAVQQVTRLARAQDPRGTRTLGLITKPDTLDRGSDSERFYVELAQNKDVKFRLGWHVLRNRSFAERDSSSAARDAAETAFFATGVWATTLKPSQLGAAALCTRLSRVLRQQIIRQLPAVIEDVTKGIEDCKEILARLGPARVTITEKRRYLLAVSTRFTKLARAAVDGIYTDAFFRGSRSRRLRAVVQNTLADFARDMRRKGHAMAIVDYDDIEDDEDAVGNAPRISRSQFLGEVQKLMMESRGRELPGTYNPLIVAELFSQQCQPWQGMVRNLLERVTQAAVDVVRSILVDVTRNEATVRVLFDEVLRPPMKSLKRELRAKAEEILQPYLSGHPITYNPVLTESMHRAQVGRRRQMMEQQVKQFFNVDALPAGHCTHRFDMRRFLDHLAGATEPDMDTYSCIAVDTMEAYYEVALKNLIDALSTLAVEGCLLQRIPSILTPETVCELADATIERVASESPEAAAERGHTTEKLAVLEQALGELRSLDGGVGDTGGTLEQWGQEGQHMGDRSAS
ncbi:hypothetical protein VTJ49DRAFT_5222 [Mycothermus thermophilus]|uniref:Uncharacterized protein n=1 Tax=Humicola insolens TaxID=85995 RepID=A0ABR3V3M4_HUMIN